MARTLITDATVITVNAGDEVLSPADVLVEDDRIAYVGAASPEVRAQACDERIDGSERVVMPGLVNAHTHTYNTLLKGGFEQSWLDLWLLLVRAPTAHLSGKQLYLSTLLSGIEMLHTGTTTIIDHYFGNPAMDLAGMHHEVRALDEVGIRAAVALIISDLKWEDTLPLNADALAAVRTEAAEHSARETAKTFEACEASLQAFHRTRPRLTCLLGPSAPQRCSDELLVACGELAERYGTGLHVHVAEAKSHAIQSVRRFGETLVGRMDRLGVLGRNMSMAHCVWLSDEEIAATAARGATVVHNPASNLKLGDGVARVPAMLRAGVNVAVGTDGPCGGDHLNMFEAMRLAAHLHTSNLVDYREWPSARQVLRMGTIDAARACGLQEEIGSVEVGKRADLLVLTRNSYHLAPENDLVKQLVLCENGTSIEHVMVDGRIVVRDGRMVTVDEVEVCRQVRRERAALQPEVEREIARAWTMEGPVRDLYFELMTESYYDVAPGLEYR
jgi:5-methylthioadenosine/S-adenosylhomocysteine deaminase